MLVWPGNAIQTKYRLYIFLLVSRVSPIWPPRAYFETNSAEVYFVNTTNILKQ